METFLIKLLKDGLLLYEHYQYSTVYVEIKGYDTDSKRTWFFLAYACADYVELGNN